MRAYYLLLLNSFTANLTSTMIWFALSLWVYVQTQSVLATSIMSGIYMVAMAVTGLWFGSIVDHNKKKKIMIFSSIITLICFCLAFGIYITFPISVFQSHTSPHLWTFVSLIFTGMIIGNIRNIAMPTVTTIMVPEEQRDKANGLYGTLTGITFLLSSIVSGFLLASSGMYWIMIGSIVLLIASIIHLFTVTIPEKTIVHTEHEPIQKFDIVDTFRSIQKVPGLLALILFTSFNNFLGGVFMPLMDPYGLSLVPLQTWGVLWGFLSLGFIFGGLFIAKMGLGRNPLKTLFLVNIVLWIDCMLFTLQPSIVLLTIGMFIYICLVPFIEASEHTIIQKIVPHERQGRVFGFAQSVESAASPLTAFFIGPIAQFFFIPFMTDGTGAELIGDWFGTGPGRGIALVFTLTGLIGFILTIAAMKSKSYTLLSKKYLE